LAGHRYRLTAAPLVAGATAVLVLSGCSGPGSTTQSSPSVNFGPDVATTPGLAGHATTGAPEPATGASASPAGTASAAPQSGAVVDITNFAFAPATLTVPAGGTVTWTNHDEEPHTVVANDGSFHSPGMGTGATYSFTFPTAGTFDYVCSIHPFMHGTVVVTA
jgi:plastocyanin